MNDNRNYSSNSWKSEIRKEYSYIIELVEANSSVIDLGCGSGDLMLSLHTEKNCKVSGIEISDAGVSISQSKGLDVRLGRIDEPLPFENYFFDFAICNVTVQMVLYPEILLREMKRISRFQIISFPNFAFYKNRFQLLFGGVMPEKMLFGYSWFNTGHIHQLSIKDFRKFVSQTAGWKIEKEICVKENSAFKNFAMKIFPNLFQQVPIFLLRSTL